MKEKILQKLKIARGENTSISDRTLNTLATFLLPFVKEETDLEAIIEQVTPVVLDINGNVNFTAARAVEEALKNIEPPTVPPVTPPIPPIDQEEPEWVKKYMEKQAAQEEAALALEQRLSGIEKGKQTETMVASAKNEFYNKYMVSDAEKALCEKSLDLHLRMNPSPESSEKIIEGWKSQYEDLRSAQGLGGLVPVGSNGGGGNGAGNEALQGLKDKFQREGKIPSSKN